MKILKTAIVIAGVSLAGVVNANQDPATQSLTTSTSVSADIRAQYQAGINGDSVANQQVIERLTELYDAEPNDKKNALALTLLGSSHAARASFLNAPWDKVQSVERGTAFLDKALKIVTNSRYRDMATKAEVMTSAACTFVKLPKMFHRLAQGQALLNTLTTTPGFEQMPLAAQININLCALDAAIASENHSSAKELVADLKQKTNSASVLQRVEQAEKKLSVLANSTGQQGE